MPALPARQVRGGRLPQVRGGEDPQRPVRQLRHHLRARGPPGALLHPVRNRPGDQAHRALLPEAQRLHRQAQGVRGRQGLLEGQRQDIHQELAGRGNPRQGHHQGHVLGSPDPGGGMGGQGHLRLVRGGHRIPQRLRGALQDDRQARRLGEVLEGPRGQILLLHREGQHPIPLHHLAVDPHGDRRRQPALRHPRQRVPHAQRRQALQEPRRRHRRPQRPGELRRGPGQVLPVGQHARHPRLRLLLGGLPDQGQQRARGRPGQLLPQVPQLHQEELRHDPGGRPVRRREGGGRGDRQGPGGVQRVPLPLRLQEGHQGRHGAGPLREQVLRLRQALGPRQGGQGQVRAGAQHQPDAGQGPGRRRCSTPT